MCFVGCPTLIMNVLSVGCNSGENIKCRKRTIEREIVEFKCE
jgi:hypothetical protein